jgi:hypothetical protein
MNTVRIPTRYRKQLSRLESYDRIWIFDSLFALASGEGIAENDTMAGDILELIWRDALQMEKKAGKFHWNWRGGITPLTRKLRGSLKYKEWRTDVFNRDSHTCQKCNIRGGILHAHHIEFWSKNKERRFDVSNGITLCKECHLKAHTK